ncbi:reverse transcriptase [Pseudomonas nitroreducens]|uniref:reverse transcriptase n=1 Tax=Pseudomonas nitroreducens TaxID=46680 RepID=UPI003CC81FB3
MQAYYDCRRSKRNSKSALAFEFNLERNIMQLHHELNTGAYQPGASICFVVTHPKHREVWAADFRDRIVHHLLYNHIGPRIERSFIVDSCACIKDRGTLYGAQRLEQKVRSITRNWKRRAFYLKCDLANFFVSLDKRVLEQLLAWQAQIEAFLADTLHARLNPSKTILQPIERGIDFVGQVILPHRRTTRPRTVETALRRVSTVPAEQLRETANSYFGLLGQASHSHNARRKLARVVQKRGRAVAANLRKTFKGAA